MTEKKKKLTAKEEAFCWNYVNHHKHRYNGRQAALIAGYSKDSATEIASENLRKPHIRARIEELINENKDINAELVQRVIDERKNIAFSDVKEFWKFSKDGIEMRNLSRKNTRAIESIKVTKEGVQFKLYDKLKALDGLAKYLGIDKEVVEHQGKVIMVRRTKKDAG